MHPELSPWTPLTGALSKSQVVIELDVLLIFFLLIDFLKNDFSVSDVRIPAKLFHSGSDGDWECSFRV